MSSRHPTGDADDADERGVAVDPVTALGTALSRLDGRVATLADRAGQGPLLVAVVERGSPTCRAALQVLAGSGARFCAVSQGRPEAATELRDACGLDERDLLVEPAPHPVSDALAAEQVPTFVLVDGLELAAWQDGWDRRAMRSMVARAGGRLDPEADDLPDEPHPSRLALDEEQAARAEDQDAARRP
jgi:hypothetical protein